MPSKQRVKVVDPFENDTETKRENLKVELTKTINEYIKDKCDKEGNIKNSNLTNAETKGLDKLKERIEEKEIFVVHFLKLNNP